MIDMDQVEDFYEALSAAIESGLDTPGAHAVSDMYRAAIARAEVAEARADALEDANAVLSDALESTRRKLEKMTAAFTALKAAGEWRPVTERPPTDVTIEMIVVGLYRGNNEFWDESFGAMVEPTHWRPGPPDEVE